MEKSQTSSLAVRFATGLIRLWQWQAPFWGPRCRFYPSCSTYMREALNEFGFWKGLLKGTARLLKCHPWHPGGVDLVKTHHE